MKMTAKFNEDIKFKEEIDDLSIEYIMSNPI